MKSSANGEERPGVVFHEHPDVVIATNTFRNVPTILQYEDQPLIEVGRFVQAGFTTQLNIFHNDGTRLAVVKGAQVYPTADGEKAKVTMRYANRRTIVELEGKTILELQRDAATALRLSAELYAPEGVLITARDNLLSAVMNGGKSMNLGGAPLSEGLFEGQKIAIHVTKTGIQLGGPGGRVAQGKIGEWSFYSLPDGSVVFNRPEVVPYTEIDLTKNKDGEGKENPPS